MFNQINNNHCPGVAKRIKRQKQPNWNSNEIVNIMRRRDFEKKRHNNAEYKKLRNKCKLMIRNSKTTFYKETIQKCKNDPLELVKCFNAIGFKNVNHDQINTVRHKGIITKNGKDIVNLFNYSFGVPPNNCFKIPLISHQFVFKYINEMKGNKSTGHDDISARFIKLTAPYITD